MLESPIFENSHIYFWVVQADVKLEADNCPKPNTPNPKPLNRDPNTRPKA